MKSAPTLEFKGSTLALTVLHAALGSADAAAVERTLADLCGPAPDFFSHDPTVVDLAGLDADAQPDWGTLLPLLRRHQLTPFAVRNASPAQAEAARAAGLVIAEEVETVVRAAPAARSAHSSQASDTASPAEAGAAAEAESPVAATEAPVNGDLFATPEAAPAPAAPELAPAPAPAFTGSLVVDRPLRSGQQVYARGGDVIVLAMVNPGAEVIADGNIHVYAPLRGRALAGARGDVGARIFTTCFEAELVSIAGVYRTFEPGSEKTLTGQPVQVRLAGADVDQQQLRLEPLNLR